MNNCKLWCCGSRRFTETSRTPMDWIKPMCRQRGWAYTLPTLSQPRRRSQTYWIAIPEPVCHCQPSTSPWLHPGAPDGRSQQIWL